MATVALEQLVKRYGAIEAVRAIDLDIAKGEFVALVGPSGCGKSTTLRMIAGLEEITSGTIRIGGEIVNDLPPRARNISMVFQSYALYPHMSVRENLGFSLKIAKRPQAEIDARVAEASDILHLRELLDRRPSQLSGGQRQRVAMGRAIVRKPQVFLFDEPLSNLDAKLRAQMRTEIKLLHARVPSTVIYVTHDQVEAMTLADRIVIMRDGLIEQARLARGRLSPAGQPLRRRLHRLADHEPGRRRNRRRQHRLRGRRLAADAGPVQERRGSSERRVALGLRPDDVLSNRTRPAIRRRQPARRAKPCGVGHGAARQRDARFRHLRRTRLGDPHAQSCAARIRTDHWRLLRSRQGASL